MKNFILALALVLPFSHAALAGDKSCELSVTRVACEGKEAESYKKCDGKAACTQKTKKATAAACAEFAKSECANSRLDITKSKTITATYEGQPVEGGKNVCDANRPDFNKCK